MSQVLFSCVGTTDPARGEHDGGMMHILRYYRPSAVWVCVSPEMEELEQEDRRFEKMLDHMRERWEGYAPEFRLIPLNVKDVSDLDELDKPLTSAFDEMSKQYPKSEILVNLSSGSPQMKLLLSQLVLDIRYHTRGIQVKTPEKKAGTTPRTNDKQYNVDEQLWYAEEVEGETEKINRCVEPKLIFQRREAQWQQIEAMLRRRDYEALYDMKNHLPAQLRKVADHLYHRSNLQDQAARACLQGIDLGFDPYPRKAGTRRNPEYDEVSEYFLIMKNMQYADRYTDFVLRLNPLTIRLQAALIDKLLWEKHGIPLTAFLVGAGPKREQFSAELLQAKLPELSRQLNGRLAEKNMPPLRKSDPSIVVYNILLHLLTEEYGEMLRLFDCCERLNLRRNRAAHQLYNLTKEEFTDCARMTCREMVKALECALETLYPQCDPALFEIYGRMNKYIRDHR